MYSNEKMYIRIFRVVFDLKKEKSTYILQYVDEFKQRKIIFMKLFYGYFAAVDYNHGNECYW